MCPPEAGRLLADFAAIFGCSENARWCDLPVFQGSHAFTLIYRVLASRRSTRSMRLRHSNILATLVCVLLQLGVATSFAQGLVLCVADDGHVAVELSHVAARCVADYRRHHPEPLSDMGSDLDSHACTDTVLGSAPAWRHAEPTSLVPSRSIAVTAILGWRQTDHATLVGCARASAAGSGFFDCRIDSLRSVVLVA